MMDCPCGGHDAYIDWWINFRKQMCQEVFVRCPDCGKVGKSCTTADAAIEVWRADGTTADLQS